jgi:hypothetical protein
MEIKCDISTQLVTYTNALQMVDKIVTVLNQLAYFVFVLM